LQKSVGDSNRPGLLAHPYLMSRLAYADSTSPIHRGVFLIRHMLGRTLRPPQEAFTPLSPDLHPDLTTRERIALQTSPKNCQVCHAKINALGFTLENFDAIGRFRVKEDGRELDTAGVYTDRGGQEVKIDGPRALSELLATSHDAHRAFVDRAFERVGSQVERHVPVDRDKRFAAAASSIRLIAVFEVTQSHHRLRDADILVLRVEQRLADRRRILVRLVVMHGREFAGVRINQVIAPVRRCRNALGYLSSSSAMMTWRIWLVPAPISISLPMR